MELAVLVLGLQLLFYLIRGGTEELEEVQDYNYPFRAVVGDLLLVSIAVTDILLVVLVVELS